MTPEEKQKIIDELSIHALVTDDGNWDFKYWEFVDFINAMPEESKTIQQSCEDGCHAEPHVWAYLDCDCPDCINGRNQIAKQKMRKFLDCCKEHFSDKAWFHFALETSQFIQAWEDWLNQGGE